MRTGPNTSSNLFAVAIQVYCLAGICTHLSEALEFRILQASTAVVLKRLIAIKLAYKPRRLRRGKAAGNIKVSQPEEKTKTSPQVTYSTQQSPSNHSTDMRPRLRLDTTAHEFETFQFPLPPSSSTPTERMNFTLGSRYEKSRRSIRKSRSPAPLLKRSKTFPPPPEEIAVPTPPLPNSWMMPAGSDSAQQQSAQQPSNPTRRAALDTHRMRPKPVYFKADASYQNPATTGPCYTEATASPTSPISKSARSSTQSPVQHLDSLVTELQRIFDAGTGDPQSPSYRISSSSSQSVFGKGVDRKNGDGR